MSWSVLLLHELLRKGREGDKSFGESHSKKERCLLDFTSTVTVAVTALEGVLDRNSWHFVGLVLWWFSFFILKK